MKKIITLTILLLTTSCSSFTSGNRSVASYEKILADCTSVIRNFFSIKKKKTNEVTAYTDFKQFFRDNKYDGEVTNLAIAKSDLESLKDNNFLKDLGQGISDILLVELRKIDRDYITLQEAETRLIEAVVKKINTHDLRTHTLVLLNRLHYAGFKDPVLLKILKKSDYNYSGPLSPSEYMIKEIHKELSSYSVENFKKYMEQVSFSLLDNRAVDESIVQAQKYLKFNNKLQLADALTEAMKERSIFDTNYIFKNLSNVLDLEEGAEIDPVELTSGLELLALIKRGSVENVEKVNFTRGMKEEDINKLKGLVPSLDKSAGYDELATQISQSIPSISYKKLLNLDYYTGEIQTHRVYDQCNWGSCWIQSPVAKFETELSNSLGRKVGISTDYFYMRIYLSNVMHLLNRNTKDKNVYKIAEGGFALTVDAYAQSIGFIPEAVWKPKVPFHNHGSKAKLQDGLDRIFKKDIDTQEKEKLVIKFFDDMFGRPPETFNFEGQEYTAKTFYDQYREFSMKEPIIWTMNNMANDYKPGFRRVVTYEGQSYKITNVPTQISMKDKSVIDKQIIKSIESGKAVGASFKWLSNMTHGQDDIPYIDLKTGLMTAPKVHSASRVTNKKFGGHMILIVGYDLDELGGIKTYKVLNSWGNKKGDNGIFHMDKNYFNNYLRGLFLNKDTLLGDFEIKKAQNYWASI